MKQRLTAFYYIVIQGYSFVYRFGTNGQKLSKSDPAQAH